jgi:hypothetical protein
VRLAGGRNQGERRGFVVMAISSCASIGGADRVGSVGD